MSIAQDETRLTNTEVECFLSASDSYIETLNIKTVEAQPWLVELVIPTQLRSATNPDEKRVKSRTCLERTRLAELQEALGTFLQSPGSSGEPLTS